MAGKFVEQIPNPDIYNGPTNIANNDFSHRYSDSVSRTMYFGSEGAEISPDAQVEVRYKLAGDPNQPSLFYGPDKKLGRFISSPGMNRSFPINLVTGSVETYFVLVEQPA